MSWIGVVQFETSWVECSDDATDSSLFLLSSFSKLQQERNNAVSQFQLDHEEGSSKKKKTKVRSFRSLRLPALSSPPRSSLVSTTHSPPLLPLSFQFEQKRIIGDSDEDEMDVDEEPSRARDSFEDDDDDEDNFAPAKKSTKAAPAKKAPATKAPAKKTAAASKGKGKAKGKLVSSDRLRRVVSTSGGILTDPLLLPSLACAVRRWE